jgi:hypothetical protein
MTELEGSGVITAGILGVGGTSCGGGTDIC